MMQPELAQHRPALMGHCYRMLGSSAEADDAVQETLVRAWRAHDRFDGRSSLKTWLTRIATNVCLDALASRKRRELPLTMGPVGTTSDTLRQREPSHWLEPIPDTWVLPGSPDPGEQAVLRQSVRLAFVAALQHLPPRQRAILLLRDVLGWSAAEVSESVGISTAAANSALQRARATLAACQGAEPAPAELTPEQRAVVDRYVAAFERYDVDAISALLHEEATMCMPPFDLWLQGPTSIAGWLGGRGIGCRGSRLLPTAACGMPAFGQYRRDGEGHRAWSLITLDLRGDRIGALTHFLDVGELFPRFGLPLTLPPE